MRNFQIFKFALVFLLKKLLFNTFLNVEAASGGGL